MHRQCPASYGSIFQIKALVINSPCLTIQETLTRLMEILTSVENTIGKYPHKLVDMMNKIVESAEKYPMSEQMADTWL